MSLPPSSPSAEDDIKGDSTRVNRTRTVRKNEQEKRRRNEFKDSLTTLHKTLLQHDEVFRQESHKRETRLANKKDQDDIDQHGILGNQSLFNRVEIINQAAFTINRIMQENTALRAALDNSNQGSSKGNTNMQVLNRNSDMKSIVAFHEGVGPVLMVPDARENQSAVGTASSNPSHANSISTAHRLSQSPMPLTGMSSVLSEHHRQALGEDLLLNPFRQHQDMPLVAGYNAARVLGNQQQDAAHLQLQSIISMRNAQSFLASHRQPLVMPSPALSFPALPTAAHMLQEHHPILDHGRSGPAGILAILQDPVIPTLPTVLPSQDSVFERSRRATRSNRYDTATEVEDDAQRRKRKRANK